MRINSNTYKYVNTRPINDTKSYYKEECDSKSIMLETAGCSKDVEFTGNPIRKLGQYFRYLKVQNRVDAIAKEVAKLEGEDKLLLFRNLSMENIEGLQYGIKVFDNLSMKDIQYLCENLHVIAVKRGCKNMCGYCYANAVPQKREMSWEDYTAITGGIKEIRKRLHNLPIFGENHPLVQQQPIYGVTELFYDADCMDLAIKDKNGKFYDFIDMLGEISALGRKSCFDTSGWLPQNKVMQARAEKYAEYFSNPENMNKLEAFNLSFNVFSASNVAAVRAERCGDFEKANRLREKYTDRIANAIYTFTPLLDSPNFGILNRSFGFDAKNAKGFDCETMFNLINAVNVKLLNLYKQDLATTQKYVKTNADIHKFMKSFSKKVEVIDTGLNSSGRMRNLMETFNIKAPMQDHDETTPYFIEDLIQSGRYHRIPAHRLIDTDGKVYHMDYARFFPTEIQLNIQDQSPTTRLANLSDFTISRDIINKKEYIMKPDDVIMHE